MFTELSFLHYRSVIRVKGEEERVLNSYSYDPFGKLLEKSEQVRNILQYVGKLGIIRLDELVDFYLMRARVYDASHGRFISIDPLG